METKTFTAKLDLKEGAEEGAVRAAFSIFNTPDSMGDIVRPSFFTDGQEIPMAAWGHSWESLPPGKGVIRVREKFAEFDGRFFLDTTHGLDHYRTVKHMGGLQEWSFGFNILNAETGEQDGEPVRFLTRGETFEASPVLVGMHRDTHTLAIKGLKRHLNRTQMDRIIAVILEALSADDLADADEPNPDDGKSAEPPTLDVAGAKLLDDIAGYVTRLQAATDDDVLAVKESGLVLLRRLSSARLELDGLLKRAVLVGAAHPRELRRQFDSIEAQIGSLANGRRAG